MNIFLAILVGIIVISFSCACYLTTAWHEKHMHSGWLLLGFILSVLLGDATVTLFHDSVNLFNVHAAMAATSFIGCWLFLFYAYKATQMAHTKLMFTFLIAMFLNIMVCSITFTQLGNV